jgi:hypothetical protein
MIYSQINQAICSMEMAWAVLSSQQFQRVDMAAYQSNYDKKASFGN